MGENSNIAWTERPIIIPNATGRQLGAYKKAAKEAGLSLAEWISRELSGLRKCYRCSELKRLAEFSIDRSRRGGRAHSCKSCTSHASTASRYETTRGDISGRHQAQNGRCPICQRIKKLVVDHEHGTGRIRALLCNRCNVGLGQFKDDLQLLKAAVKYLEAHSGGK